ncbi:alpha/beta hydrolase [Ideonella azotifigens]|uniref:Alpha/beta hydrolase n=1 Tax=Ideonella azotifigens TaxID=513160 RepID=A0ABN1JTI2_9BURK|nr:alpha/beta hydrolase [Ideonella azotifigens]MCD2341036.1 alpha/beta hydrolase [Ideonella azotifigens]
MKMVLWRMFGILLMLTALSLPLMQAPDRAVETLVAHWALPPSEFIEVKGQLVHLRDEGPRDDPAPLLLIHGTGDSLHTWEGWTQALKGQRRVIRFDLPGFGLTGPFTGQYAPDDYRDATLARFTLDLMDQLKLQQVVIAGNSLGGEVAWRVAAAAPQRVEKLILVDSAGYDFRSQAVPIGFLLAQVPVLNKLGEYLLPRAAVEASLRAVYAHQDRVTPELVERFYELTLREGNRRALGLSMRQLDRGAGAAQIATLRLPTLILWGQQDKLIPPDSAQRFAHDIPGSQLVMLDGLGHVPQEEDPAASVAPVKGFLGLK